MTLKLRGEYYTDGSIPINISVSRDGQVAFDDRDMDYEVAFAAMSGETTPAMMFLEDFEYSRWQIVYNMLTDDVENVVFVRFLADCVEHVLPLYLERRVDDNRPWLAIEAARAYLVGSDREPSADAEINAFNALSEINREPSLGDRNPASSVARAAHDAMVAVHAIHDGSDKGYIVGNVIIDALYACTDAMWLDTYTEDEAMQAMITELAWQWRRFYDIMTALRAGRDWPDMKGTP